MLETGSYESYYNIVISNMKFVKVWGIRAYSNMCSGTLGIVEKSVRPFLENPTIALEQIPKLTNLKEQGYLEAPFSSVEMEIRKN